jgi:hypothetical protein
MNVVCAIAMLNGKKWARQIFFGWMCLSVLVTFAISRTPLPLMIIPGVLFQSVLLVFLFRSEATVYFSGKPAMEP